ncbi:hypothetical protein ABTX80_13880 [Streptomyces erythrochromogenes]
MATLLAWGRRCRADRDLRIAFSGYLDRRFQIIGSLVDACR